MAANKVDSSSVPANATTAPIGAKGSDASNLVTKDTTKEDGLASDPSHEREQGLPGASKAFSHANDFKDGELETEHAAPGSVEALTENTPASDKGNSKFLASLEAAKEKQEESGSTAI